MKKILPIQLQKMRFKDLKAVLEIEKLSFAEPYCAEIFKQELKVKAATLKIATYHHKIIGYIDYWLIKDQMELISIAVHPKYLGCGVAKNLMDDMIQFATQHEVKFIFLDVRASNTKAKNLYEKFGFEKIGIRKRYYSDNHEDAIMMKKVLS